MEVFEGSNNLVKGEERTIDEEEENLMKKSKIR